MLQVFFFLSIKPCTVTLASVASMLVAVVVEADANTSPKTGRVHQAAY